jgi:hypothetical protein
MRRAIVRSFPLHALLSDRHELGATRRDRVVGFAKQLEPTSAAKLMAVVEDGVPPPPWLVEECAEILGIGPAFFVEWRLREAGRLYDVRVVGFEGAFDNLARWATARDRD